MTIQPTDPKEGLFAWLFHDISIEHSWNVDIRLEEIETYKPLYEKEPRKRYITYVPESLLPEEVVKAWQTLKMKKINMDPKISVYDYSNKNSEYTNAELDFQKAEKAFKNVMRVYYDELLQIALKLVPDVPWDEKRKCLVFPKVGFYM